MFADLQQASVAELHAYRDPASGLHALIAIHSTRLGPALGGCRFLPYRNEQDALADALRLARGMSYKAALAGLPLGGGKAVIMAPPMPVDRAALFRAFGRAVESLGGRYITAVDSGTELDDLDQVATTTRFVWGHHGDGLDPSPHTAEGVYTALTTALQHRFGSANPQGRRFAIQGLGHVGRALALKLARAGARLVLTDLDGHRADTLARHLGATPVAPEVIYDVPCDGFLPCALGGVLNRTTVARLDTRLVVGSANNQLATDDDAERLQQRGILYVPDYLANAGGLISLARARAGDSDARIREQVHAIGTTLGRILRDAGHEGCTPAAMADRHAEQRLDAASQRAVA